MKFFSPIILLSVSTAVQAAALIARADVSTIRADIANIAKGVNATQDAVNKLEPGPTVTFQALAVQQASSQTDDAIKQSTEDANALPAPLTNAESLDVASDILNLQPNINTLLDSIVQKKPVFDKAIFGSFSASPLVKMQLTTLRADTKTFGDALIAKLDPAVAGLAPVVVGQIDQKFADTIAAYS